jgi:hypothetical protein
MTIFETHNSIYQVDEDLKRIRRVSGINLPHWRFGRDGDWQEYFDISSVELRKRVVVWFPGEEGEAGLAIGTSTVEAIVYSDGSNVSVDDAEIASA